MKTLNLLAVTVATGTLMAFTAKAGILGSPHDFHSRSWNNNQADPNTVCSVCHTPHHADQNSGPLWGHDSISTAGWQMYNNVSSPGANIKYTPAANPLGASLACLSCHDGSIAVNAYGSPTASSRSPLETVTNGAAISENNKDLTHSHPISFNYDSIVGTGPNQDKWLYVSGSPVLTPDANSSTFTPGNDMSVKGFLLNKQGNLECNSCHDVHNQEGSAYDITLNPKLVKINGTQAGVGSLLCRSCHNK